MVDVVLGTGLSDHDCSACLIIDNKLVVGVGKERITKIKRDGCTRNHFDNECVKYCLTATGIQIDEVSLIAQNSVFAFLSDPNYYAMLDHYNWSHDATRRLIDMRKHPVKAISHHLAHAYAAYYLSEFDNAAILVIDSMGNEDHSIAGLFEGEDCNYLKGLFSSLTGGWERESFYHAEGNAIRPLFKRFERDTMPYGAITKGLGIMYHEVTEYIFGDGHRAGETMGLAPYGDSRKRLGAVNFANGDFLFSDDWLLNMQRPYLNKRDDWNARIHEFADLASACQKEFEEAVLKLCWKLYQMTGATDLCFAGGSALNSVCNTRILKETPFKRLFIPPAAGDSGISLGCAMWAYNWQGGRREDFQFKNDFIGKKYSDEEIINALDHPKISWKRCVDVAQEVAQIIADGKVVAWFQGGSEFGPRALGNRSILGDPRRENMKDILNSRVKFRQSFRPFAPSVLAEYCGEYFNIPCESPYMLLVAQVFPNKLKEIPAVVHFDGSARVQTVTQQQNARFYKLISHFNRLTGCPIVVNTSFNVKGEPIVETPVDAVKVLLKTGIDFLGIGDYLAWKTYIPAATGS